MSEYTKDWKEIATRVKAKAKFMCERCHHRNDLKSGHVLTVHHLDGNKKNNEAWNLAALCQRCHLSVQNRVNMRQDIFEFYPISDWFKPHLEGYKTYLEKKKKGGSHGGENTETDSEGNKQARGEN